MLILCRCVSDCQFRGNVAEKDEQFLLDSDSFSDKFIRDHFAPVDENAKTIRHQDKSPQSRKHRSKTASSVAVISSDELTFMQEGR